MMLPHWFSAVSGLLPRQPFEVCRVLDTVGSFCRYFSVNFDFNILVALSMYEDSGKFQTILLLKSCFQNSVATLVFVAKQYVCIVW